MCIEIQAISVQPLKKTQNKLVVLKKYMIRHYLFHNDYNYRNLNLILPTRIVVLLIYSTLCLNINLALADGGCTIICIS